MDTEQKDQSLVQDYEAEQAGKQATAAFEGVEQKDQSLVQDYEAEQAGKQTTAETEGVKSLAQDYDDAEATAAQERAEYAEPSLIEQFKGDVDPQEREYDIDMDLTTDQPDVDPTQPSAAEALGSLKAESTAAQERADYAEPSLIEQFKDDVDPQEREYDIDMDLTTEQPEKDVREARPRRRESTRTARDLSPGHRAVGRERERAELTMEERNRINAQISKAKLRHLEKKVRIVDAKRKIDAGIEREKKRRKWVEMRTGQDDFDDEIEIVRPSKKYKPKKGFGKTRSKEAEFAWAAQNRKFQAQRAKLDQQRLQRPTRTQTAKRSRIVPDLSAGAARLAAKMKTLDLGPTSVAAAAKKQGLTRTAPTSVSVAARKRLTRSAPTSVSVAARKRGLTRTAPMSVAVAASGGKKRPPLEPATSAAAYPTKQKQQPSLTRTAASNIDIIAKPRKRKLQEATRSVSVRVPKKPARRKLQKATSSVSISVPKKQPPSPKPRSPKPRSPRRAGRGSGRPAGGPSGRGAAGSTQQSDMKVAPTQQVTVAGGQGSAGIGALVAKIDQLLKEQKDAKRKTAGKKAFAGAKKQYKDYRKKMLAAVKTQNKDIKKKELARIRRMPTDQRAKARSVLKQRLAARAKAVKDKLPTKISDPAHLQRLISASRTLKV